jgi:hypothetical protein
MDTTQTTPAVNRGIDCTLSPAQGWTDAFAVVEAAWHSTQPRHAHLRIAPLGLSLLPLEPAVNRVPHGPVRLVRPTGGTQTFRALPRIQDVSQGEPQGARPTSRKHPFQAGCLLRNVINLEWFRALGRNHIVSTSV